jgi:rhodanese-related sulfurtransferase
MLLVLALAAPGFQDASNLEGGMAAWRRAGF